MIAFKVVVGLGCRKIFSSIRLHSMVVGIIMEWFSAAKETR